MWRALLLLVLAGPAQADTIAGNLRFTLLHELGHAVIDQWKIAPFGPEEVAADGFALVAADRLMDEGQLAAMIEAVTLLSRQEAEAEAFDPWGDYMPGGQRLAFALCLYYGLRPEKRGPLARALGMPAERARPCAAQARTIRRAWAPVLTELTSGEGAGRLRPGRGKAMRLLAKDLAWLNATLALRRDLPVVQEACGEDNAFYFPYDERIVICAEMVDALRRAVRP
jgi:hypothetical protein